MRIVVPVPVPVPVPVAVAMAVRRVARQVIVVVPGGAAALGFVSVTGLAGRNYGVSTPVAELG